MRHLKRQVGRDWYNATTNNDDVYTIYGPKGLIGEIRRIDQGIPGSKHRDVLFCPPNTSGLCWRSLGYAIARMVRVKEEQALEV